MFSRRGMMKLAGAAGLSDGKTDISATTHR